MTASKQTIDNGSSDPVNDNESPDSVNYKVETQKGPTDNLPDAPLVVQIMATMITSPRTPLMIKWKLKKGSNDIRPNATSLVQITATTQLTIISWAKDSYHYYRASLKNLRLNL